MYQSNMTHIVKCMGVAHLDFLQWLKQKKSTHIDPVWKIEIR